MTLNRVYDAALFEHVLQHPDVLPWVSLGHDIGDIELILSNPENVCLMNDHGGFLFYKTGEGDYEVHTAFVPEGRGAHLVDLTAQAARYMAGMGARRIFTFVDDKNTPARRLAEKAGMEVIGSIQMAGHSGVLMMMECATCQ